MVFCSNGKIILFKIFGGRKYSGVGEADGTYVQRKDVWDLPGKGTKQTKDQNMRESLQKKTLEWSWKKAYCYRGLTSQKSLSHFCKGLLSNQRQTIVLNRIVVMEGWSWPAKKLINRWCSCSPIQFSMWWLCIAASNFHLPLALATFLYFNAFRLQPDSCNMTLGCHVHQNILPSGFWKDRIFLIQNKVEFTSMDNQHWMLLVFTAHRSLGKDPTVCQLAMVVLIVKDCLKKIFSSPLKLIHESKL